MITAVAKPSSRVYPVKSGRSQRFSRCSAHYGQTPQVCPSHGIPTHRPTVSPSTLAPEQVDSTDDLVVGNDRHLRIGQLAVDDMQVGAANTESGHLDANLARTRISLGELNPFQCRPKLLQHHRMHNVFWLVTP